MGGKRFRPSEATLKQIVDMSALHLSTEAIAALVGTSRRTLIAKYAHLIAEGRAKGKAAVAARLFDKATTKDNTQVQLFIAERLIYKDFKEETDETADSGNVTYETQWGGNTEPSDTSNEDA